HLDQSVMMFADQSAKPIEVNVEAAKNKAKGTVRLNVPKGWQIEPAELPFDIDLKGDHQRLVFKVIPTQKDEIGELYAEGIDVSGTYSFDRTKIAYPHITEQNILVEAKAKIVRLSLKKKGERLAYVMGAGDEMPQYLRQIGYQVDVLGADQLNQATLKNYDAVIVGIRAYNTVTQLKYKQADLIAYATAGGTVIVQYNTSAELVTPNLGPFPFKISRVRVTDENAAMTFLLPEHIVLNQPNKISSKDFDGWVQERGLYFPETWDPAYEAVLACNDPGEPAANGGLLVAKVGKGHYVYSSLAWFRELPAGVPGAYRLFANLLSLGK
ncbi:MAG: LmbE family protein, partial [Saprospiraceae bacterium]